MNKLAITLTLSLALAGGAGSAAADELATRVLVVPLEVDPSAEGVDAAALTQALERAADQAGADVSRAEASLTDTAVLVGCDESDPRCLDDVAAALNVDRILFGTVTADGDEVTVALSLTSREGAPSERSFSLTGDTEAMVAALESDVPPFLVEAVEERAGEPPPDEPPPDEPPDTTPPPDPTPEPTPPPTPAPQGGGGIPVYAWALLGGGVAIAAGGGGIALWGRGLQDDIDDAPTSTADDLDALRSLEQDAKRRTRAGTAVLATGLVVASAGAVFAVLGSRERRTARPGDVAVAPTVVRGGGGVSVTIVGF